MNKLSGYNKKLCPVGKRYIDKYHKYFYRLSVKIMIGIYIPASFKKLSKSCPETI